MTRREKSERFSQRLNVLKASSNRFFCKMQKKCPSCCQPNGVLISTKGKKPSLLKQPSYKRIDRLQVSWGRVYVTQSASLATACSRKVSALQRACEMERVCCQMPIGLPRARLTSFMTFGNSGGIGFLLGIS